MNEWRFLKRGSVPGILKFKQAQPPNAGIPSYEDLPAWITKITKSYTGIAQPVSESDLPYTVRDDWNASNSEAEECPSCSQLEMMGCVE